MSQSNCATLRVQFFVVDSQLFDAVGSLTSESFVDLPDVDVADLLPCLFQKRRNSHSRTNTHQQWVAPFYRVVDETGKYWESKLVSSRSTSEDNGRGSVTHLRAISSSGASVFTEGWLELSQDFQSCTSLDSVVFGDHDFLFLTIGVLRLRFDWNYFTFIKISLLSKRPFC